MEPTHQIMKKLRRKADYYRVNGFVVAAHIARAWKSIRNSPSSQPQELNWFLVVVENALKAHSKDCGEVGPRKPPSQPGINPRSADLELSRPQTRIAAGAHLRSIGTPSDLRIAVESLVVAKKL
jgi:hypothetical protein